MYYPEQQANDILMVQINKEINKLKPMTLSVLRRQELRQMLYVVTSNIRLKIPFLFK